MLERGWPAAVAQVFPSDDHDHDDLQICNVMLRLFCGCFCALCMRASGNDGDDVAVSALPL